MHKYYYLYKITNIVNNKIYIGVHRTNNLNDDYFGSGFLLRKSIKKFGIENFRKEILEFFNTEEDMFLKESEYVDEEFLKREDVYNIKKGGYGGFTREECIKGAKTGAGGKVAGKKNFELKKGIFSDPGRKKQLEYALSEKNIIHLSNQVEIIKNSEEIRNKIKNTFKENKHQQGNKNSRFGTMWITNGLHSKTIKKNEKIPDGWRKGRIMKVME